jgi:hypothetical protein
MSDIVALIAMPARKRRSGQIPYSKRGVATEISN